LLLLPNDCWYDKAFHVRFRWISLLRFFYFNFFSTSFCITFPSDSIVKSINKHVLSFLLLTIISGLFARISLSYYILDSIYYYYCCCCCMRRRRSVSASSVQNLSTSCQLSKSTQDKY
jgi:hypothetical protein